LRRRLSFAALCCLRSLDTHVRVVRSVPRSLWRLDLLESSPALRSLLTLCFVAFLFLGLFSFQSPVSAGCPISDRCRSLMSKPIQMTQACLASGVASVSALPPRVALARGDLVIIPPGLRHRQGVCRSFFE